MKRHFLISNFQRNLFIFCLPLTLLGLLIVASNVSIFRIHSSSLSNAITIDVLITIPLVYLLLIWKTKISKTTVAPLIILGVLIATYIVPEENQYYLNLFKTWILPLMELSIIAYVLFHLRKTFKKFQKERKNTLDFYSTLQKTCAEILPKYAVIPVITEISVFYYGFICWKKRPLQSNEFTYHKNSGTLSLLVAIIMIIAIESVSVHVLIAKWNDTFAWIFTALSIYSGIQLFGFLKSILYLPIYIEDDTLFLRYGIMSESEIPIQLIESVEITSKEIEPNSDIRRFSFLGSLEPHNLIIRLKEENRLTGLYGFQRKYRNIALHVDNPASFKEQLLPN